MHKARFLKLTAALCALLMLAGCFAAANGSKQAAALQDLLEAREAGVNGADQQKYLSTVLPSDAVLTKEETNLIRASASLDIDDYTVTATALKSGGSGGYTARLKQSYTLDGERHLCDYDALFINENGRLYYAGPAFQIKQNDRVKVYYTGQYGKLAQELLNEETAVLTAMKDELGFAPKGFISVKLYDDQQVFLQSVKLNLPAWVGGWHEFGEAIKSFTGAYGSTGADYRSALNHETTHRMVSELSNDNASYWMQEGLASVLQNTLGSPVETFLSDGERMASYTPFTDQKKIDLEKLGVDNQGAVSLYYSTSKAFAAFLLEEYGWDKVKQALTYMQKFDMIPVTGAEKMAETNTRTDEALKSVFGFENDGQFQMAFETWQKGN